jgi:hypothetical protein
MRWSALACGLLVAGLVQAGDPLPALEPVDVEAVLPDPLWKPSGRGIPSSARAAEHVEALKADPLYGDAFLVEGVHGEADAERVAFVIPQFHRHPSIPVTWNTFGKAIIRVQRNVEALITRLNRLHGLDCVGTEGSWVEDIGTPFELRQAASWAKDLTRTRAEFNKRKRDARAVRAEIDEVHDVLQKELARVASIYDGVGMAQVRARKGLHRFGLEDRELNQKGLALHARMKDLDEALAKLDPGTQSVAADAMGELWLLEIEDYEKQTLGPLRRGLKRLDQHRTKLRQAGADDAVFRLGRFVSLAKLVTERAVQLDEVDAHTAYYREVRKTLQNGGEAPVEQPRKLTADERKERARLLKAREKLQVEYDEITLKARDRAAARRLVERMNAQGSCALVFGMAHKDGLVAALDDVEDLAVVVVTPYDPEALAQGKVD